MKTHSSSIATLPAKRNTYQKRNVQQELASQEIKIEDQKQLELQHFSIETNKIQNTPKNSQLIKNQYSESVSGVDFFA